MKSWFVFFCLPLLLGCVPVSSQHSIPGTYLYSSDLGRANLSIYENRSFVETYSPVTGAQIVCRGIWDWDSDNHKVVFRGAFLSPTIVERHMAPSECFQYYAIEASRDIHGVYLEDNPDNDEKCFRKVN